MVIPRIHPLQDLDLKSLKEDLDKWLIDSFGVIAEEQGGLNSPLVRAFAIIGNLRDPYCAGFIACYMSIRQALIDKEIKDLEEMVNAERP